MGRLVSGLLAMACLSGCGSEGSPVRVAVLLSGGIEQDADWRLVNATAAKLTESGFQVSAETETLPGVDLPAEARAAMARNGSATAVVLTPSAKAERDGVLEGTKLWAVTLDAMVVNERDLPVETTSFSWSSEKHQAGQVQKRVTNTWADATASWAVDRLFLAPQMEKVFTDQVEMKELEAATALQKRRRLVEDRRERVKDYAQYCNDELEALGGFLSTENIACYGNPCGQTTLVGVGANNQAILQDTSRIPLYTVPLPRKPTWMEPPERLYALDLASGEKTPLLSSANFYGMANMSPAAAHGAVETFSSEGHSGIYGFSTTDGSRSVLSLLEKGEASRFSRVSPDGTFAMACLKGAGCFVDDGTGRTAIGNYDRAMFVDTPAGLRVFGSRDGAFMLEDPAQPGVKGRVSHRGSVQRLLGLADGRLNATVYTDDGCALMRMSPTLGGRAEIQAMPDCLDGVALLPDGRLTGTAEVTSPGDSPGDPEVVVWASGANTFTPLTKSVFLEEYPLPSADGTKILFNRRLDPPPKEFSVGHYRRVVCVVDVPEAG